MDRRPDESHRPPAVDVPPADVAAASDLLADLETIRDGSDALMRGIEGATGVLAGEVSVIEAVAGGEDHVRAAARRTGQPIAATREIAERLVERGLLGRHPHDAASTSDGSAMLHVTDAGQAVLEQVEAMRLRMTDALLSVLGRREAEQFRETMQAFSALLSTGPTAIASAQT